MVLEKYYVTVRAGGFQTNRIINVDYSFYDISGDFTSSKNGSNAFQKSSTKKSMNYDDSLEFDSETVKRLFISLNLSLFSNI